MIAGEADIAWLRLTNQLLAVAIFAAVAVIGISHARNRRYGPGAIIVATLMVLFSIRLLLAVFGDLGFSILEDTYRLISNSVSFSILIILVAYIIYDSKETRL